jgi:hypothetical protein
MLAGLRPITSIIEVQFSNQARFAKFSNCPNELPNRRFCG